MTSNELWIVFFLGLVGYWVTSAIIRFLVRKYHWGHKERDYYEERTEKEQPKRDYKSGQSCYEVLGVSSSSSLDEIKVAYRNKISMYHPDKVSSMGPEFSEIAERISKEINRAYNEAVRLKK
jgi:hypothetical protein